MVTDCDGPSRIALATGVEAQVDAVALDVAAGVVGAIA